MSKTLSAQTLAIVTVTAYAAAGIFHNLILTSSSAVLHVLPGSISLLADFCLIMTVVTAVREYRHRNSPHD